jgi:hypothetical protein
MDVTTNFRLSKVQPIVLGILAIAMGSVVFAMMAQANDMYTSTKGQYRLSQYERSRYSSTPDYTAPDPRIKMKDSYKAPKVHAPQPERIARATARVTYRPMRVENRYIWNEMKSDATESENKNHFAARESTQEASKWNAARFQNDYTSYKAVTDPDEQHHERLHNAMMDGYYGTKERMRNLVKAGRDPYTTSTAATASTSSTYAKRYEAPKSEQTAQSNPSPKSSKGWGYYN